MWMCLNRAYLLLEADCDYHNTVMFHLPIIISIVHVRPRVYAYCSIGDLDMRQYTQKLNVKLHTNREVVCDCLKIFHQYDQECDIQQFNVKYVFIFIV